MAVGMLPGQETKFYDPFYRENVNRSSSEDSLLRCYDDFSVFNYLHLPKPQSLSISSPRSGKNHLNTSKSTSQHEFVCDSVPTLSTPQKNNTVEAAKDENEENQTAAQNEKSVTITVT
ncbi:hypothetical protein R1flu_019723 [Riccia fluitans]|uniref:Uncharacterized protein n=1 Tax=Riccia fluitans TaxID=41844 RepID=A0ABD1ZJT6_9MARC